MKEGACRTSHLTRASSDVLGNKDLARHIMSKSHEASRLLSVASAIRNNEECTQLFEGWSARGCPFNGEEGDEHARHCLQAVGGTNGDFCLGSFNGYFWGGGWRVRLRNEPSKALLAKVKRLLHAPPPTREEPLASEVSVSCFPMDVTIRRKWPRGTLNVDVRCTSRTISFTVL